MKISTNGATVCLEFFNLFYLLQVYLILILGPIYGQASSLTVESNEPVKIQWCGSISDYHSNIRCENHHLTWICPESITAERSKFISVLKPSKLQCEGGNGKETTVYLNVTRPLKGNYTEEFLASGHFRAKDFEYFHPQEYCIAGITDELVTVKFCEVPECGGRNPCIPVCCPLGKLFSPGQRRANSSTQVLTCSDAYEGSSPLNPVLYTNPNRKVSREMLIHFRRKRRSSFKCPNNGTPLIMPYATNEEAIKMFSGGNRLCYRIREDGILMYRTNSEWGEVTTDNYCLEGFQFNPTHPPFRSREEEFGALICSLPPTQPVLFHSVFYGSTMIFSSVFLFLTFIVHILLWSQQNIHGWTTMCHAASMFFMYVFLGTVFLLVSAANHKVTRTLQCKILGIITHFFFLSTFCWLTLINFDLFWTFRCMSPRSQRSRGARRFLMYALFGWGMPFVIVTISFILDTLYASEPCSMVITPEYGVLNCWVSNSALGRYVYYPVAGLWTVNLLFFATTTYKLYVYKKSTQIAMENLNEHQQLFRLFLKLFFVMGCTWIFEFLSWFHAGNEIKWYWTIFDFINLFQAVAIFIIFVCKEDILCSLQKKYPVLKPILKPIHMCLRCGSPAPDDPCTSYYTTTDETNRVSMNIKPSMRVKT